MTNFHSCFSLTLALRRSALVLKVGHLPVTLGIRYVHSFHLPVNRNLSRTTAAVWDVPRRISWGWYLTEWRLLYPIGGDIVGSDANEDSGEKEAVI